MLPLYDKIEELCKENGINITLMCKNADVPRSTLSDYKAGRIKTISVDKLSKIANYFNVTVDYLLGNEEKGPLNKEPTKPKLRSIARLEEMSLSPDEDEKIAEFIEVLLKRKKDKK